MEKEAEDKLKQALMLTIELDNARMAEESEGIPDHEFSPEFEQKMDGLIRQYQKKSRRRTAWRRACRAAAAFAAVCAVVFALIWNESGGFAIELPFLWFEDSDDYKELVDVENDILEEALDFDVNRITYIPEGYELIEEENHYQRYLAGYSCGSKYQISIMVWKENTNVIHESGADKSNYGVNKAGYVYEYSSYYSENQNDEVYIVTWKDDEGICYQLTGTESLEVIIDVMEGFTY